MGRARARHRSRRALRAEHITREALAGQSRRLAGRVDDSIVSVNPKIGATWLVSRQAPGEGARAWTRLRASAGTGIRPPDAFEIAFTDNPALKPERSKSVEVGVTQALLGGAVSLDATTFFNRYDDLIISVGQLSDISRYRTDNISNARARGVEVSAAYRPAARPASARPTRFSTRRSARSIERRRRRHPTRWAIGCCDGRSIKAALDFTWTTARATAFASLAARGTTLDAEPAFGPSGGLFENPGRAVVDTGGSFRVVRGVDVFARVLNLFDKAYEEVLGFPAPGRTAFAGVRLAAGR